MIDTHIHLDGEEFLADVEEVIARAHEAGVTRMFVPGINAESVESVMQLCRKHPGELYPMIGLHPEDVKADYREVLDKMHQTLLANLASATCSYISVGEIGLDYYWSREFENEQLDAFRIQVEWAIDTHLPLMIHCRKAQNEMVNILRSLKDRLPGGVFHCFTGNEQEAKQLLEFDNFLLGIGGVLTFKKSNLPDTLRNAVPLERIVLETDAPYMSPVPLRGQRNESSHLVHVVQKLAEVYDTTPETVMRITTENAEKLFLS